MVWPHFKYPNFFQFSLITDASEVSLGAVLSQVAIVQDGAEP